MDIFGVFFLSCVSIILGIVITLFVQYYLLYVYFKKIPVAKEPGRSASPAYALPEGLKNLIESDNLGNSGKDCSIPIGLVMQFLFHELRHSESIKCWLYRKLTMEFDELLTKTTIGKFFDSISIKDMNLGNQFPDIKAVSIEEVKLNKKEGYIETLSICLDIDYSGNFLLCVDGKMKFGKSAFLSIKVKRVNGLVRLQFTRNPYTHWSFSFYTDPLLDLAVESHFQGRQLQSNITNLIVHQIKKAIKRKHTLPNYKIRYKPFFQKTDPSQLDTEESEIVPQGQLEINCAEISRLSFPSGITSVYYTCTIDAIPWICIYQKNDTVHLTFEITLTKLRQAPLGVSFKQESGSCPNQVFIDCVSPHSLAFRSGLRTGDVVLMVENKTVTGVGQVTKLIKSTPGTSVTLRIERIAENYVLHSGRQNKVDDLKVTNESNVNVDDPEQMYQMEDHVVISDPFQKTGSSKIRFDKKTSMLRSGSSTENVSKFAQTIGNFALRKRKASISDRSSNDNSARNTPNSSNPTTPQHTSFKQAISLPTLLSVKKQSISELPEIPKNDTDAETNGNASIEVYRSCYFPSNPLLQPNEEYQFELKATSKYVNVNVWGTCAEGTDLLLGYANIPLSHILGECCNSVLGHYTRRYSFLPPTNVPPNSTTHPLLTHSGFEHVFCYGDILLSFIWSHDEEVETKKPNISFIDGAEAQKNKHDFVRRQFHRTTQCDFCTKKIWLKDAVQCRQCGMCCHKKCLVKCQLVSDCQPADTSDSMRVRPEITMTEANAIEQQSGEIDNERQELSLGAMKRVNSVSNLLVPGEHSSKNQSRSLPPSPQRTPSRKASIGCLNPFLLCPDLLEDIQKDRSASIEAINYVLEQVLLCPADEHLMDLAKETGQSSYQNFSYAERTEKINVMMTELKKSLDHISNEHVELTKRLNAEASEVEKAKIAFLIGQADAKIQGLSVLMLHYCSSLQHQDKVV